MADFHVRAFEGSSSGMLRWEGRDVRCALGLSGIVTAEAKQEGDGATPAGLWPMRHVFWRADRVERPDVHLAVIPLNPQMGWCDDPFDVAYNRLVRLPFRPSHERLWREDHIYDLIVVLGYNDQPVLPGRGSAIFLHIARPDFSPTEGCVACTQDDLIEVLRSARPGDRLDIALAPASPG